MGDDWAWTLESCDSAHVRDGCELTASLAVCEVNTRTSVSSLVGVLRGGRVQHPQRSVF